MWSAEEAAKIEIQDILNWVREYQDLLEMLGLLSLLLFVVTLVVFPRVIIFRPKDYFVRHHRDPAHQTRQHPAVWLTLTIVKNLVGWAFILAGIVMLVLPGQGILTILIGVSLANFPGKYALERRLVRKSSVARALNRVREKAGKPRLEIPADEEV